MEAAPEFPAHDEAARVLREAGVPTGAAEAHGIITGILCAPHGARVAWWSLILGREAGVNREMPAMLAELLGALHRATYARLHDVDCDFAPLLPGDEHSLAEQIEGTADWCRGYLLGLHAGGVKEAQALAGEAGEFLRDVARISEIEREAALADEQDAQALAEIIEYLRVGVQLVFEELQPPAARH